MMDSGKYTVGGWGGIPVYMGLLLGALAIGLVVLKLGYLAGLAVGCIPFILYGVLFMIKNPYWAFTLLFIANYFILGIIRYVPSLAGGVVIDGLIMFNLFTLLLRACYKKVGWGRARNGLTLAAAIWLIYCIMQLFNPQSESAMAWVTSIRGYALYFFVVAVFTPIIFYRYKDLKRILFIWSVLTLLAVLKSYVQRRYGFDDTELHWLFVEGGRSTHIIHSGVRYFSFFSDAANFGSSMGLSMVVLSITALFYENKWIKFYYLVVAAAAFYGMMISGTRSSLAIPFAGYALFVLMSKHIKIIVGGVFLLVVAFIFLNYTTIGQGNGLVRRARSAFNLEDPSFQVRLKNQRLMSAYLSDKPFGVGIGHGGGKAKRYNPEGYMSQIATDSWFVMVWAETGIVGLLLHLVILFYILFYGMWQVMFRLKDKQLRGLTGALTAGVFGIMVTSYGNEVFSQFPNGIIIYMSQAFIFLAPRFDKELQEVREEQIKHEHEYLDD